MGKLKAKDSIVFGYPVDFVYRTVTDIASYGKWWPHEVRTELEYLDPNIIGTRLRVQNGPFVKWLSVISGFHPNKLLAIDYVDGAWKGKTRWSFEEISFSETRLTMEIDINPNRMWLKAISGVFNLSKIHSRQIAGIFSSLGRYLEQNFEEYKKQNTDKGISIAGIDHLVLPVADINRSRAFYRDVFRVENITSGDGETILKFGNQKIMIVEQNSSNTANKNEVIFRMELNTPLDKVRSLLKEKGVTVMTGALYASAVNTNSDMFFIKDPDGYLIALRSNNRG
jgi:ribosome-associated toxin RatA of RatAB toxin-antitoxin module/predicted enzyme related to lactoylglutathione lyase